jgi:hypothetical protein
MPCSATRSRLLVHAGPLATTLPGLASRGMIPAGTQNAWEQISFPGQAPVDLMERTCQQIEWDLQGLN